MSWVRMLMLSNVGQQVVIDDIIVQRRVVSSDVAQQIAQAVDGPASE